MEYDGVAEAVEDFTCGELYGSASVTEQAITCEHESFSWDSRWTTPADGRHIPGYAKCRDCGLAWADIPLTEADLTPRSTPVNNPRSGGEGGSGMSQVYVASSWRNDEQPVIVEMLRQSGHEVYDFRHPHLGPGERGLGFQWSQIDPNWEQWSPEQYRDALQFQRASDGFAADLAGMEWADTCVLLLPSGRSAHAEGGWMAGQGKRVIVHVPGPTEPELMYLLFDCITVSDGELLEALAADSTSEGGE